MAWHFAARAEDLKEDEILGVTVAGQEIALYRLGDAVHATGNICSHGFAMLSDGYIEDGCVECPLHRAQFDIVTGEVRSPPATEAIPVYALKIEGGEILVEIKDKT